MNETPQQPEQYLTVTEVAKLLKMNPATVYNWIGQCGESEGVFRVGTRCTRIKGSIFFALFEAGKIPPKGK